jgi:predicted HTH transcriptional regulator
MILHEPCPRGKERIEITLRGAIIGALFHENRSAAHARLCEDRTMHIWTFLTNHAQVLLCIARNQRMTAKEIAEVVGITERAVQRLIRDLEESGYIMRVRVGRQNRYVINTDQPMRHPAQGGRPIGELIDLLTPLAEAGKRI